MQQHLLDFALRNLFKHEVVIYYDGRRFGILCERKIKQRSFYRINKKYIRASGYNSTVVDDVIHSKQPQSRFQNTQALINTITSHQKTTDASQNNTQLSENTSNEFQNMTFIEKVKMIIFEPTKFFNIMPQKGGYKEPIIFYTIFIIIPILLYVLYLTIVDFFSVETFIFLSITVSIGLLILILINLFLSPLFFNILFKR